MTQLDRLHSAITADDQRRAIFDEMCADIFAAAGHASLADLAPRLPIGARKLILEAEEHMCELAAKQHEIGEFRAALGRWHAAWLAGIALVQQ